MKKSLVLISLLFTVLVSCSAGQKMQNAQTENGYQSAKDSVSGIRFERMDTSEDSEW